MCNGGGTGGETLQADSLFTRKPDGDGARCETGGFSLRGSRSSNDARVSASPCNSVSNRGRGC